ncbi:hypothetical protein QYM36_008596 [Artemia franciscana]|uniref:Aspartate dehydrogenase domain-containing protein n=1 Tax=Artemia franciscana TaxID=6661 RepID=A0AA88HMU5_ARTSF|nr:hypothetical protein QYM36_008596 [Artemia franciscana]
MSMRKPVYSVYHSNKISSVHCLGLTKGEKMKIGILGFGHIGQYLYEHLSKNQDYQIVFVWNRTKEKIICVPQELILDDIDAVSEQDVELIIEVAHPDITKTFGEKFLDNCSYFIGSPTALANAETYKRLKTASERSGNPVYVPCGALWGAEDIARMARAGTLKGLEITMKKHPSSFKLEGDLKHINDEVKEGSKVLYEGSIRDLCPLAPNNVNTMAAAAIAAGDLGFDAIGRLVSDSRYALLKTEMYIVSFDRTHHHAQHSLKYFLLTSWMCSVVKLPQNKNLASKIGKIV